MRSTPDRALVERLYAALGAGDAAGVERLLSADFVGRFAEGLPAGGGEHAGPAAAREDGWWAIGRRFAARAEPEEWISCEGGRLLVRGRYRGRARGPGGGALDAAFMHLWTIRDGKLVALEQLTDTALWVAALG
jgi:ketosteroid isomerase-like protein